MAVLAAAVLLAQPAQAATPPRCENDGWSRPGLTRTSKIYCSNSERVRVVEQPSHGRVTGEHFDGYYFRYTLTTHDSAPQTDEFVLEMDGPAGPSREVVRVTNVPLKENTPPRCERVETALRTSGTERAEVEYDANCWDEERDDMTIYGAGPGQHLHSPMAVHNGINEYSPWWYRTAVTAGPEFTSFWAVDSQGARSNTASVSLMVGPAVDRLPECRPNPASWDPDGFPIFMRPGVARRFTVICDDADGDALDPRVATPPLRGTITHFDADEPQTGWWGVERWIDVTYQPVSDQTDPDPFSVLASTPRGVGLPALMQMVPTAPPTNHYGGCGAYNNSTTPGTPVTIELTCSDEDGDPLTATIIEPPMHGTADDPTIGPWKLGYDTVRVRYTPNESFRGIDLFTVRVGDEHGYSYDYELPITVDVADPPPPPIEWTPGPDPDGWHWSPDAWRRQFENTPPSEGQAKAITPAEQARRALRTRSVRLVRRLGSAAVYAPRRPLKAAPRVRALAVTCAVRCNLNSVGGLNGARAAKRVRTRVTPGRAKLVVLRMTPKQRHRLRRTRRAKAVFRIKTRPTVGRARSGRVALRLRR